MERKTEVFGVPWEREFGYVQAAGAERYLFLAGQVAHDADGRFIGDLDMEAQMRAAYANVVALLARYGATIDDVVDETVFVTDIEAAFAAGARCRRTIFGGDPRVTTTMVQVPRLSFPQLMIEIRCVALLPVRVATG